MYIIIDLDTGESWSFPRVSGEYGLSAAYLKVQEIVAKGHKAGGDSGEVKALA